MDTLNRHPLIVVCLTALAISVAGLAVGAEAVVGLGLLVAVFSALAERMRGRTDVSFNRDGFTVRSTLMGPERELRTWRARSRPSRATLATVGRLIARECAVCGFSSSRSLELAHIVPLALGGQHTPANVRTLCASCNRRLSPAS